MKKSFKKKQLHNVKQKLHVLVHDFCIPFSPDITNPLLTLHQATHPSHDPNAVDAHVRQRSATPRWTWWVPGWLCHGGTWETTPK